MKWELLPAPSQRGKPTRYVGLLNKAEDFNCILLASLGWSNKAIRKVTGLSQSQITYRLHKAAPYLRQKKLTRQDFRNGESKLILPMFEKLAVSASRPVTETLRLMVNHK